MLAHVHRRPPPSATCPDTAGAAAGERPRTGVNETETETRGQAAHHGAARPQSVEAISWALHLPGPRPAAAGRCTACKFALGGLAAHAEPDGTRQSCYAVGLHPCQFIWPLLYRSHRV